MARFVSDPRAALTWSFSAAFTCSQEISICVANERWPSCCQCRRTIFLQHIRGSGGCCCCFCEIHQCDNGVGHYWPVYRSILDGNREGASTCGKNPLVKLVWQSIRGISRYWWLMLQRITLIVIRSRHVSLMLRAPVDVTVHKLGGVKSCSAA